MSTDKPRFDAQYFYTTIGPYGLGSRYIGNICVDIMTMSNAWLDEREKEGWQLVNVKYAKVVYSDPSCEINGHLWSTKLGELRDTHCALLINIEEWPKAPCKHEPLGMYPTTYCRHCHKKLKAKWEAEGE